MSHKKSNLPGLYQQSRGVYPGNTISFLYDDFLKGKNNVPCQEIIEWR